MADIEKLVQDRTRIVFIMASTFALWQGSDIVTQVAAMDSVLFLYASLAKIFGAIAYALSALLLLLFYKRVNRAKAAMTLKDDWNRLSKGLAVQYGFFFMIAATVIMYAVAMFWDLPVMAVLQGLILVGVTATLLAFGILQGSSDGVK
ncbi:hypothetical protein GCM10009069_07790 [Algimonas arctica]|uniref:Uncharacterized protein n=1 Tax=Algimonas arctica TaxID=1479486 RepID=A0A8J3G1C8_9PROT|nr:hypothetical protein [Algimonas arctica]GHA86984.1 hypothetical protein GCM10009069_07790 [Algimonas arctica]